VTGRARVLVVDDDDTVRDVLRRYLARDGHEVIEAADGITGLNLVRSQQPDLLVLDLMLPGMDGLEVCREVRRTSTMPVIMLTALGQESDRVVGLEYGADDYVVKPFSPRELGARLNAVLRRRQGAPEPAVVESQGLEVDLGRRVVRREGEEVHLTPIEFELLRTLVRNRGRLMTHRALLGEVWGAAYVDDIPTLRTHIARLRAKVEPADARGRIIRTEPGVGYRFT